MRRGTRVRYRVRARRHTGPGSGLAPRGRAHLRRVFRLVRSNGDHNVYRCDVPETDRTTRSNRAAFVRDYYYFTFFDRCSRNESTRNENRSVGVKMRCGGGGGRHGFARRATVILFYSYSVQNTVVPKRGAPTALADGQTDLKFISTSRHA